MPWHEVIWTDGPDGNVALVAGHGIVPKEVEEVLEDPITAFDVED